MLLSPFRYALNQIIVHSCCSNQAGRYRYLFHPRSLPFAASGICSRKSCRLWELHTLFYQKVQNAYNTLLEAQDVESGQDRPKQLPETLASLHARNVAYREALRDAREIVIQANRATDLLKASTEANQKVKNKRLAEKRELRAYMLKEEQTKRQTEIAK